jgi:hypothetical protein
MLKKSSPLKQLGQMEPNLAGSIYVRSSIRGPYIDAFCQVWFHLAQLFQRSRLKYEKVNGRTTDAKWWQYLTWPFVSGELKKYKLFSDKLQWSLSKLNLFGTVHVFGVDRCSVYM